MDYTSLIIFLFKVLCELRHKGYNAPIAGRPLIL